MRWNPLTCFSTFVYVNTTDTTTIYTTTTTHTLLNASRGNVWCHSYSQVIIYLSFMQGLLILEMDRCISVWVLYNHNLNEYRLYVMLLYFLQAFLVYTVFLVKYVILQRGILCKNFFWYFITLHTLHSYSCAVLPPTGHVFYA